MPASCCSCNARRNASCLPSISSSPCSFQGDQRVSGCASQEGFGRLPAVEVGNSFCTVNDLVFNYSKGEISSPLGQNKLVGLDEILLNKLALLDSQAVALFAVIYNARQ